MPQTFRPGWRSLIFIAVVTALCALLALSSATATPSPRGHGSAAPDASASALCTALIQKKGKLVAVYQRVYAYKFVKVKGSQRFVRKIVKVKKKLRVPCAKQCVAMKKRKGKLRPVYVYAKKRVLVKKSGRLVRVKKRVRTYKLVKCRLKKKPSQSGTPVTITLLDGSRAILDFGAFQRYAPVRGALKGFVPGGLSLNQDNLVTLTKGELELAPTDIFIDDDCKGRVSAAIRTGDPSTIGLDKGRTSTSTVFSNGTVTATTYTIIHLPIELRNDDNGCDSPYLTTGYTNFKQTFFLKGKLDPKLALTKLKLTSAPQPVDVPVCLSLGVPTSPCNGFEIPFATVISTELYVSIKLA